MKRRALAVASITLGALACATPPHARAPAQEEPLVLAPDAPDAAASESTTTGDRVVLAHPDAGNYFHGYWQVSDDEAERADSGVEAFLRGERPEIAAKLRDYYGQIFGVVDEGGRKLIHLNFLCKTGMAVTLGEKPGSGLDWQKNVIIVADGGPCYFNLDFDPESGAYENLIVNGEA